MFTLPESATAALSALLIDPPAEDVVRRLYGAAWTDVVRRSRSGSWTATRYPHPDDVVEILAEVLSGVIAHDGRSTRQTTTSGWWLRSPDGWRPIAPGEIASALVRALDPLLDTAVQDRDSLEAVAHYASRQTERPTATEATKETARGYRAAHSDADLRAAVLSSLRSAFASHGRTVPTALQVLRGRLVMSPSARAEIAREWLTEALDLGLLEPTSSGRLLVSEVREALARDPDEALPLQALFRGLDDALGPRIRRVEWPLDRLDDLEDLAA